MRSQKKEEAVKKVSKEVYASFDQIDGSHSFKSAVPDGYVDYAVRTRHGGAVFYFNFDLAREMGLMGASHDNQLSAELEQKILDTFALVIINEYDVMNSTPIHTKDIRANRFMATRYLQLQHPNKQGKTSGDGRGIWNGEFKAKGINWDVSSSGTGATCLSPAHAQTKKFFKTGDKVVGYGNGYNCVSDGLSAALMSEVFHENGIDTERTLAIISFEGGTSINVRAAKNLFRPAHFFNHLKQSNLPSLKGGIDYFINRQVENGEWNALPVDAKPRYSEFAEHMAKTFASIAAQYEAEYIFCWLDWDGDNILANGGIIDYGSVRQFGLYHHEYRYDDVDRMSTNIPEQRLKARYIVQNFAQAADYLITGKKKPLSRFKNAASVKSFDRHFTRTLYSIVLKKLGFNEVQSQYLLDEHFSVVKSFKQVHSYFEKTTSQRGTYTIEDGITCDAIFCMKDLHRRLPQAFLRQPEKQLEVKAFVDLMKSSYAKPIDLENSSYRSAQAKRFQKLYLKLATLAAEHSRQTTQKMLLTMSMRASLTNFENRITGDGVLHVTSSLLRNQKRLSFDERLQVIQYLIEHQTQQREPSIDPDSNAGRIVFRNIKAIRHYRESF
jgi:uncharacterized protein YdiU (UPF0061 family)